MYAFLSSKYGYGLLTQSGYGGVVKHIEPHHVEGVQVPVLEVEKQKEIHALISEVSKLRVESTNLLNQAVKYFESEIGESKVHLGFQHGIVSSKKINGFHKRLDGQYNLLWKALKEEQVPEISYDKIIEYAKSIFVGGRGKKELCKKKELHSFHLRR